MTHPLHTSHQLRVATYNIHKCAGFDRRTDPERVLRVLRELDTDILCLQEVVDAPGTAVWNQATRFAEALEGYTPVFGANRELHGGGYGNLTLTRLPLIDSVNHDLSQKREPRGVLQTNLRLGPLVLHVFNLHMGTGHFERRAQARRLFSEAILGQPDLSGPRLVLGDFNEWTRGLTTRLFRDQFHTFAPRHALQFPRTYPGLAPILTLDHCFFDPPLELRHSELWRSPTALIASDHLPLLATFHIPVLPAHTA